MEVSSLQIGFDALIALLVSVTGALGVWYSLKGKVTLQQIILDALSKDLEVRWKLESFTLLIVSKQWGNIILLFVFLFSFLYIIL